MIGDQNDFAARLKAVLPAGWFADTPPVLNAVLAGFGAVWASVYALYAWVVPQTRMATTTDAMLDLTALDFYGPILVRRAGEADASLRNRIGGLTAGTPGSNSVPLSWTAPSTGGAVASYLLQYRLTGGSSWTQVSGITGTSSMVSGLAASSGYDFQVAAVNSGGTSSFTATTTASGGGTAPFNEAGYLLTMGSRPQAGPFVHNVGTVVTVVNDNSISADGSNTAPAAVSTGWSLVNTIAPTTGLHALLQITLDGHNQWSDYSPPPTSAGAFYLWFIAYNSGGTIVAAYVSPTTYTAT